jgi:hypothetical protein
MCNPVPPLTMTPVHARRVKPYQDESPPIDDVLFSCQGLLPPSRATLAEGLLLGTRPRNAESRVPLRGPGFHGTLSCGLELQEAGPSRIAWVSMNGNLGRSNLATTHHATHARLCSLDEIGYGFGGQGQHRMYFSSTGFLP